MGSVNKAILVGNLGRDAEMRFTAGGTPVATVSLATTEKFTDRDGQKREDTQWHRVVIWGKTAESLHEYLTKGKQIYVEGPHPDARVDGQGRQAGAHDGDSRRPRRPARAVAAAAVRVAAAARRPGGRERFSEPAADGPTDIGPVDAPSDDDIPF